MKSFSELCARYVVHKKIDTGTQVEEKLSKPNEKIEGICQLSPSSQSRLKHRNNSKDYHGNGKHEELDGKSDEHFGDANLFAGQTGRRLAAPTNDMGESDGSDGGGCQHYDRTTNRDYKPVKYAIQSINHCLISKVIIVDVRLPGKALRAHLVETRDLIHGSDGEPCRHKTRHADNNYEGDSSSWDATFSFHRKQDADTSFD